MLDNIFLSPLFAKIVFVISTLSMLALIRKPLLVLGIYMATRPLLQPGAILEAFFATPGFTVMGVNYAIFAPLLLILCAFFDILGHNKKKLHKSLIFLYLFLFLAIPSFLVTPSLSISFGQLIKFFTALAAYGITYNNINSTKDIQSLIKFFAISSIAPIIYGYYQFVTATGHAWLGPLYASRRIDSIFMAYNALGEYLSILLIIYLVYFLNRKSLTGSNKISKTYIVMTVAAVATFIMALNRGSWIALTIGIIASCFLYRNVFKLKWLLFLGLVIAIAAGPMIMSRFDELSTIGETGRSRNTFVGRYTSWQVLLDLVWEHPVAGVGLGVTEIVTAATSPDRVGFAPHNDYLAAFVETGVFGGLVFFMFVISRLIPHLKKIQSVELHKWQFPFCVLAIYYIIITSVQNIFYNVSIFPFFMVALALSDKIFALYKKDSLSIIQPTPSATIEYEGRRE